MAGWPGVTLGGGERSLAVPRLSIIVPVYRVQTYLPKCLDSLLENAPDEVEILAIDDGSPDQCGQILDDYAIRDGRVRVVHLPARSGLGGARNVGLDHASG